MHGLRWVDSNCRAGGNRRAVAADSEIGSSTYCQCSQHSSPHTFVFCIFLLFKDWLHTSGSNCSCIILHYAFVADFESHWGPQCIVNVIYFDSAYFCFLSFCEIIWHSSAHTFFNCIFFHGSVKISCWTQQCGQNNMRILTVLFCTNIKLHLVKR